MSKAAEIAVRTSNPNGASPFVIVCDHASNRIPAPWGNLGLSPLDRVRHIAWDPGALAVSVRLSALLDAPVVHSTVSRLVIDCNRAIDAPDLVPAISETTEIPGNLEVSPYERQRRIAFAHTPYHRAIEALLDRRRTAGRETVLVCVHSFTPVFKGISRPWEIGLIHARDPAFTLALRDALATDEPTLNIGWNEPYSALNGVTYTLEYHGDGRGLEATMIEIRNDEIADQHGVDAWAERLARTLPGAALRAVAAVENRARRSQPNA